MQATVKAGLRYINQIYQPKDVIEGSAEAIWYLAQQGYVEVPAELQPQVDALRTELEDQLKAQIASLQQHQQQLASGALPLGPLPILATPLVGDTIPAPAVLPPPSQHKK